MPEGLQDDRARGIVPFDQFPGPASIPTPDIQDDPGLCLRVNATWAALLSSLLDRLDQPDVWEGTEEQIYAARQRVIALQVLLDGINDCMCVDEFTASAEAGSPVSVSYDPITNNFHFVIPPGATGATGPTGPQGPSGGAGTSGVVVDSLPLEEMDSPRCQVSTQLRQELETVLDDWLDVMDAQVSIAQSITGIVGTLAPVIGVAVVALAEAVNTAISATTAAIRSGLTTAVYDAVQCHLHCNLDESNPWIDTDTRNLWAADVFADTNIPVAIRTFLYWSIVAISPEGLQYFSWRAQFIDTPTDCGFCTACEDQPWEHTINLSSGNTDGLEYRLELGTAIAGGLQGVFANSNQSFAVLLHLDFAQATHITRIRWTSARGGTGSITQYDLRAVATEADMYGASAQNIAQDTNLAYGTTTFDHTVDVTTRYLQFFDHIDAYTKSNESLVMSTITLNGTGFNPFE